MQRIFNTTDTIDTTGIYKTNTTVSIDTTDKIQQNKNNASTKKYEVDFIYEELSDLVNSRFRAWYCQRFFILGRDKVLQMASVARADGKDPKRYFSVMLKAGVVK